MYLKYIYILALHMLNKYYIYLIKINILFLKHMHFLFAISQHL